MNIQYFTIKKVIKWQWENFFFKRKTKFLVIYNNISTLDKNTSYLFENYQESHIISEHDSISDANSEITKYSTYLQ